MKEHFMKKTLRNKLEITIANDLTINYAAEIYKLFAEALKGKRDILITISSPSPVDVTFLQILHAFLAKCASLNKKVFFEINKQNELREALMRMGYYDIAGVLGATSKVVEG
jgi:hypothetical protein